MRGERGNVTGRFSVSCTTQGARVSELIGLRCRDVALEDQPAVLLRGKGRKERSLPLWRPTAAIIRGWRRRLNPVSQESYLFPNRTGGKMTRSNVTQRLKLAVAGAIEKYPDLSGRSISPHTIRHTTAMHLLQSGVDITVIALWLTPRAHAIVFVDRAAWHTTDKLIIPSNITLLPLPPRSPVSTPELNLHKLMGWMPLQAAS